jgi:hypothetical protein
MTLSVKPTGALVRHCGGAESTRARSKTRAPVLFLWNLPNWLGNGARHERERAYPRRERAPAPPIAPPSHHMS